MPTYKYRAKIVQNGKMRSGEIDAPTAEMAKQKLQSSGLNVLSVKQKPEGMVLAIPGTTGVSGRDLVVFSRQLSTMIDAGLPIVQALDLLASQEANLRFNRVLIAVKSDVETGMTFGDALKKHPGVFSPLYCSLVAAGEAGGVLDTILQRLCVQIEKSEAMKRKIKSSLTYPVGTLVVAIGILVFMLWKVIPTFQDMFSSMGGQLPSLTQFLVDASEWVSTNILYIFITLIGAMLFVPGVGNVVRKSAVSTFTRTLGTMLSSGVPLLDGLTIVSTSISNSAISESILFARQRVSEGSTLADPLLVTGIFPNMVVQMIRVGEETGALDVMLNKIADFYDEEVDDAIGKMMALIEPAMMCLLAVLVGGMLIGMYLPIFSMSSAVKT